MALYGLLKLLPGLIIPIYTPDKDKDKDKDSTPPKPTPEPTPEEDILPIPTPEPTPEEDILPDPTPEPTPGPILIEPTPDPTPEPTPGPVLIDPTPDPTPGPVLIDPTPEPYIRPYEGPPLEFNKEPTPFEGWDIKDYPGPVYNPPITDTLSPVSMTPSQAEDIIRDHWNEEGLFLIKTSTVTAGTIALASAGITLSPLLTTAITLLAGTAAIPSLAEETQPDGASGPIMGPIAPQPDPAPIAPQPDPAPIENWGWHYIPGEDWIYAPISPGAVNYYPPIPGPKDSPPQFSYEDVPAPLLPPPQNINITTLEPLLTSSDVSYRNLGSNLLEIFGT
jgi:hypothetical protein